jgi:hypothetical protein
LDARKDKKATARENARAVKNLQGWRTVRLLQPEPDGHLHLHFDRFTI